MARLISRVLKPGTAVVLIGAVTTGLAFAGSDGGVEAWSLPLFGLCGVAILTTNWLGYLASLVVGDNRFVEIGRPVTFMVATAVLLIGHPDLSSRVVTIAVLVEAWAIGAALTQLQTRGSSRSADESFVPDSRRSSSLRVWTFYALVAYATVGAGFAAATSTDPVKFGPFSAIGISICSAGFLTTAVAVLQRLRAARLAQFASSGVWKWSRHPDLFGEVLFWLGISVIAYPVLQGWQYITLFSPVVVYALSVRVISIPAAERRAERGFAQDTRFNIYTTNTPTLWPRRPR